MRIDWRYGPGRKESVLDTLPRLRGEGKQYLNILYLAARESVTAVDDVLRGLIDKNIRITPWLDPWQDWPLPI